MRRRRTLTLLGVVGLTAIAVTVRMAGATSRASDQPVHYGVEWSIAQESGDEKLFRCTLKVRDLDTDAVIAQPTLLSKWGERAEVVQTGDGLDVIASVLVSADGHEAEFEAKLAIRGRPVAIHQASVGL